jgi:hypothetical protein
VVDFEVIVDHRKKSASASVVKLPFFDPSRKREVTATTAEKDKSEYRNSITTPAS